MRAVIKRELKNYLKNPILWIGMLVVIAGVYQILEPYLKLHYFETEQEVQSISVPILSDADIMDGYIPTLDGERMELVREELERSLTQDMGMSEQEASQIMDEIKGMTLEEMSEYLGEACGYYGVEYAYQDLEYHQGSMQEVNGYIREKLQEHPFSYYFARKFADFGGLYMVFFSTILLAFLFLRDTRKDTYELLHTKPVRAWQYVLGKIIGGFLIILFILGILNLVFGGLCELYGRRAGFQVRASDILLATCVYILPSMLMITCTYAITALAFKNPLPAVPVLFLYIVYSNMGSRGPDGIYGYYGRALAILVRFPGRFFDTASPPMVLLNQTYLVMASAVLIFLSICIWKRRRVY